MKIVKRMAPIILVVVALFLLAYSSNDLSAAPKKTFDFSRIPSSEYVADEVLVKYHGQERFQRLKLTAGQTVPEMVTKLNRRKEVEYAEPNFKTFPLAVVNDPLYEDTNRNASEYPDYTAGQYAQQWALNNTEKTGGVSDADVDWEERYTYLEGTSLATVVIAVVDSGLDVSHPDLDDKVIDTYSVLDDTENVSDDYGHGTHVSGIAAAETDNLEGVAGSGFPDSIRLLPIKVLDADGYGTSADVAVGIYYAADWVSDTGETVKVINLSIGSYFDTQAVEDAVNYAWDEGIVLAAAAGNSGNRRRVYPAYYERVISVGATDHTDNVASFSTHNDGVDVSAPGVEVLSTFPYEGYFRIQDLYGRMNKYDVGSGTSMSSPHVAGLAALLFAYDETRSNAQIRSLIEQTVDDLGEAGWDQYYGYGRINVDRALMAPTPTPTPTPPPGCGDGYCAGILEGEDCFSCPNDCRGTGKDNSRSCCGDGLCVGENANNCPVDCQ